MRLSTYIDSHDFRVVSRPARDEEKKFLATLTSQYIPTWAMSRKEEFLERIRALQLHGASFRSLYNVTHPSLHRIPPELLMPIFVDALTKPRDVRMVQVCHHWRAILMDTPQFWANALACAPLRWEESHQDQLSVVLRRSGASPLYLHIRGRAQPVLCWEALRADYARLCSLTTELCTDEETIALQRALSSGMPNLHSLAVTNAYPPQSLKLSLEDSALPALRMLRTRGRLFSSDSTVRTLEHLTISGPMDDVNRLSHLSAALKKCSSLQVLNLLDTHLAGGEMRGISLPHLRMLTVDLPPTTRFGPLLACFTLPPTTVVHINVCTSNTPPIRDILPLSFIQSHSTPPVDQLCVQHPSRKSRKTAVRCYANERLRFEATLPEVYKIEGALSADAPPSSFVPFAV